MIKQKTSKLGAPPATQENKKRNWERFRQKQSQSDRKSSGRSRGKVPPRGRINDFKKGKKTEVEVHWEITYKGTSVHSEQEEVERGKSSKQD